MLLIYVQTLKLGKFQGVGTQYFTAKRKFKEVGGGGGGLLDKLSSVGDYGYFLELHICNL